MMKSIFYKPARTSKYDCIDELLQANLALICVISSSIQLQGLIQHV